MSDRAPTAGAAAGACPFLALDVDRDRRQTAPDPRHRCYAQEQPLPPSLSWQTTWCLAPTFATCSVFLAWAARAAAPPVPEALPPIDDGFDRPADEAAAGAGPAGETPFDWAAPPPWVDRPELRSTADVPAADPPAAVPAPEARPSRAADLPWSPPGERSEPLPGTFAGRRPAEPFPAPAAPRPQRRAPDAEDDVPVPAPGWFATLLSRERPESADSPAAVDPDDLGEAGDGMIADPVGDDLPADAEVSTEPDRAPAARAPRGAPAPAPAPGAPSLPPDLAAELASRGSGRSRLPFEVRNPISLRAPARGPGRSAGSGEWNRPRAAAIPRPGRIDALPAIVPPVAIGAAILLLAAVLLFLLPGFLAGGGATPVIASPSPVPSADAAATSAPTAAPSLDPGEELQIYRVKRGDTLVELQLLICINPDLRRNPDLLMYGTVITIPPADYVCRRPARGSDG